MWTIKAEIIDKPERIGELVDWLISRHEPPVPYSPTMYIDLEGTNLSRDGSISIFTLLIDTGISTRKVDLIDVHTLGAKAFDTAGARGKTLKDILQDKQIPKVFFDVRNDSDALYAHFGVALGGVEDVQLMESATRKSTESRKLLNGLKKCVKDNVLMTGVRRSDLERWELAKKKGEHLFKAENGGSYAVFNQRPILEDIISYCVGDVQYLPELRKIFWPGQTNRWKNLVDEESQKRVMMSQRQDYQPQSKDKAMSPWSREQNNLLDTWNYVPSTNYHEDFFDDYEEEEDYDFDYGPTSVRDILDDCDIPYYYSD